MSMGVCKRLQATYNLLIIPISIELNGLFSQLAVEFVNGLLNFRPVLFRFGIALLLRIYFLF